MADYPIQQIFRFSYEDFSQKTSFRSDVQKKAANAILNCKSGTLGYCYSAFYLVLNHATFKQIKKRQSINDSDGFYIGLLYAVPLVLS